MKRVLYVAAYLTALCAVAVADAEPVDYGWGPGAKGFRVFDAAAMPVAGDAHLKGQFSTPFSWPLIPLHVALLPDATVYSFGTDENGQQGAKFFHDVWTPPGTDLLLDHKSVSNMVTDTFCAAQSLLPSGKLMIVGGDMVVNKERNWSNDETNVYTPGAVGLEPINQPMKYMRWYPTLVALANGEMLVLGGRKEKSPALFAPTPEVYPRGADGWWKLTGATSNLAYGKTYSSWYYPRAFLAPNGLVFVLAHHGEMFYLNPTATGSLVRATTPKAPASSYMLPSLYFAPGKILSVRNSKRVIIVDLYTSAPTFTDTARINDTHKWGSAAVLADGTVMVSGGSLNENDLATAKYQVEIWDPANGTWTLGAKAQKPRLYHSISLLLPDASVLTGGGGAPGPINELNAEIYYPKYLFKTDGVSGAQWAPRPSMSGPLDAATGAPLGAVRLGQTFKVTVVDTNSINRVTAVRLGTKTHSSDADARFHELGFQRYGADLFIAAPTDANVATPGYWMLFVIDNGGVPSVAKIFHLACPDPPVSPPVTGCP